jgi:hypothetical protein
VKSLHFNLHAAGVLAPGIDSLPALRAACRAGQQPTSISSEPLPSPSALPANERRRSSQVVRLTLACIEQTLQTSPFPADAMRSVFATDEGTGEVCQQMLEALATTRQVSPLLFTNSVQNAPSGYFSIAWRNRQSATVASLGLESFASGLLCAVTEAMSTGQPVLLVAYDPAMTSPMDELLPVRAAMATAWIITAGSTATETPRLASYAFTLEPCETSSPSAWPEWLPESWAAHSSARSLSALGLLEAAPNTVLRLTLGAQLLCLRRIDGDAA